MRRGNLRFFLVIDKGECRFSLRIVVKRSKTRARVYRIDSIVRCCSIIVRVKSKWRNLTTYVHRRRAIALPLHRCFSWKHNVQRTRPCSSFLLPSSLGALRFAAIGYKFQQRSRSTIHHPLAET